MIKPRIVVTGATGKTGSVVVSELLMAGYPVRAMVHREDGRSARLKSQGADIVVAEMSDVERVVDALDDVQRAYYCPPIDPYAIQGAIAFAIAAKQARLEHIVASDPMAGEPLASVAHDPPELVDRPFILHDARNCAYDRQPGILCRRLAANWVGRASWNVPVDVRRQPQCTAVQRGYRASCAAYFDGSCAPRREELSPHRTGTPRRKGDGPGNRPSRWEIRQGYADAGLVVYEIRADERPSDRCVQQHPLYRRPQAGAFEAGARPPTCSI